MIPSGLHSAMNEFRFIPVFAPKAPGKGGTVSRTARVSTARWKGGEVIPLSCPIVLIAFSHRLEHALFRVCGTGSESRNRSGDEFPDEDASVEVEGFHIIRVSGVVW